MTRFVLNDQGHAARSFHELDLNEQIWPPYQDEHQLGVRHHPYTIVSAIRHRGADGACHFRALGRSATGWVQFEDLKEAVVLDSHAPHTTEWVIIWLIRENAVDFCLWKGCLLGTDIFPRQLQEEHTCHGRMFEEYPQDLLERLRCHCSICGKLVIDHDGLCKRIKLRHPEHQGVLDRDLTTQVQIQHSTLPCHACGARPNLLHRPLQLAHKCLAELNLQLALRHHQMVQIPQSPGFTPGRLAADERESELGVFLTGS